MRNIAFMLILLEGGYSSWAQVPAITEIRLVARINDPQGVEKLDRDVIQNTRAFKEKLNNLFDAYIEGDSAYRDAPAFLKSTIKSRAKKRFEEVQQWNVPFVQQHFDHLALRIRNGVPIDGQRRRAMEVSTTYNEKEVSFLRYRDGLNSMTAVKIDGKLAMDPNDPTKPLLWQTTDQANFNRFQDWFEKELGKPTKNPARKDGEKTTP